MKYKMATAGLIGPPLDWAVAKAQGFVLLEMKDGMAWHFREGGYFCRSEIYCPSTDWDQGGPIVERNWTDLVSTLHARFGSDWPYTMHVRGCTTLVAFMRCYVLSNLGDEVDIPEEIAP